MSRKIKNNGHPDGCLPVYCIGTGISNSSNMNKISAIAKINRGLER